MSGLDVNAAVEPALGDRVQGSLIIGDGLLGLLATGDELAEDAGGDHEAVTVERLDDRDLVVEALARDIGPRDDSHQRLGNDRERRSDERVEDAHSS